MCATFNDKVYSVSTNVPLYPLIAVNTLPTARDYNCKTFLIEIAQLWLLRENLRAYYCYYLCMNERKHRKQTYKCDNDAWTCTYIAVHLDKEKQTYEDPEKKSVRLSRDVRVSSNAIDEISELILGYLLCIFNPFFCRTL